MWGETLLKLEIRKSAESITEPVTESVTESGTESVTDSVTGSLKWFQRMIRVPQHTLYAHSGLSKLNTHFSHVVNMYKK